MLNITMIFDLDHTLIDSSHRGLVKPCGAMDLDHWRANCTEEKINMDTLIMPMFLEFQKLYQMKKHFGSQYNFQIIACTARVMSAYDFGYLKGKGLKFDDILSRPEGCADKDHLLKEWLLRDYAKKHNIAFDKFARTATMIDDNISVLSHLFDLGFNTMDAVAFNKGIS